MNIQPIKTPADYLAALEEIDSLMQADKGTPEGERLNALVDQVVAYEATRFTAEDRAWLDMAPVGREFGSPDCDL